jgi:hypothetical protein
MEIKSTLTQQPKPRITDPLRDSNNWELQYIESIGEHRWVYMIDLDVQPWTLPLYLSNET